MGRIVIVVYQPLPGKEMALEKIVKEHYSILYREQLVTERKPVLMKAKNGCIVEVFEWKSSVSIQAAHQSPVVHDLWARFNDVCIYQKPVDVEEFHNMFSEFEPID